MNSERTTVGVERVSNGTNQERSQPVFELHNASWESSATEMHISFTELPVFGVIERDVWVKLRIEFFVGRVTVFLIITR